MINGSLSIYGGESEGTSGGLGNPLILPGETNVPVSSFSVKAFTGMGAAGATDSMSVLTADLETSRVALGLAGINQLIGRTIEIGVGPGVGRFWQITGIAEDSGDSSLSVLTLKNPTVLAPEWTTLPDGSSRYAVTNLSANFFVNEAEQVDVASIYDDASTAGQTGTLTADQLSGLNMGVKSSGVVTSPAVINYSGLESMEIFLGSGADTFTVNGSMKRADGYQTITVVNTGAGDDTVNVSLSAENDGFFVLNTEDGDDKVYASASTLGITIFGGLGSDNITGGSGGDTIFGDKGLIDYQNGSGDVVTRLGLGLSERVVLIPGATVMGSTDVPFFQTDGVVRQPTLITSRAIDTGSADVINGGDGNNIIIGGMGSDTITTGATGTGAEIILGDNGSITYDASGHLNTVQTINPELGADDTINAGAGTKQIIGGYGKDTIGAGDGSHIIIGDYGQIDYDAAGLVKTIATTDTADHPEYGDADTITSGNGDSIILGGMGDDTVTAGNGTNTILGDNGEIDIDTAATPYIKNVKSTLTGIDGNDTIIAGNGSNFVIGGMGDDTVTVGNGLNAILGDNGEFDFSAANILERVISMAIGTGGSDTITAGDGTNSIIAGSGGDSVTVGAGIGYIIGDNGFITYDAQGLVSQMSTSDTVAATGGDDNIITRGDGNKYVLGGVGDDRVATGAGNDIIIGDNGVILFFGDENHLIAYSVDPTLGGNDTLMGGSGNDVLIGGYGNNVLQGEAGNDILIGNGGRFVRNGQKCVIESIDPFIGGNDLLDGGTGNDIMIGGAGEDTFKGNIGEDIMIGEYAFITETNGLVDLVASYDFGNDDPAHFLGTLYNNHDSVVTTSRWEDPARFVLLATQPAQPPGMDKILMTREMLFAGILNSGQVVAHHNGSYLVKGGHHKKGHGAKDNGETQTVPQNRDAKPKSKPKAKPRGGMEFIQVAEERSSQEFLSEENNDGRGGNEIITENSSSEDSLSTNRLAAVMAGVAGWGIGLGDNRKTQRGPVLDRGGFTKLKDDEKKRHFFKWNDGKFLSRFRGEKTLSETVRHDGDDAR